MENTPKTARRRFSAAQRAEVVALYRRSGLNQRSFAHQHDVGVSTLSHWLRRSESSPPVAGPVFKEMTLPGTFPGWSAEIALGQEVTVRLGLAPSPEYIAQLVHALRHPC